MVPRNRRLAELTKNLKREGGSDAMIKTPLLSLERRAYLLAIQQMVAGLVEAQVVLTKALKRID
jgi:hypothetical protein